MDERDGNRSFADGGSYSLDIATAYVADSKDPGAVGLEQIWRPLERPRCACQIVR
jgi:hypothetical protein